MKYLILAIFIPVLGNAVEIQLDAYDQDKLAVFLEKLPTSVKHRKSRKDTEADKTIVRNEFPMGEYPFKITCESQYYKEAPLPSSNECKLELREAHPDLEKANDEFFFHLREQELATSLFSTIPFGKPEKEFRSVIMEKGISFEGEKTFIFTYYFKCTEADCLMRFRAKKRGLTMAPL